MGHVPKEWCCGLITPIYKKGSKLDPDNYRGNCVMNALLKVLCLIMNQRLQAFLTKNNERLQAFLTKNNTIDRAQIGFMPKSRTTDHIFTLKTLCNKYVKDKNGGKLFACFVNFKKAYDSIWNEELFHKLITNQVNGQFLNIIQIMYKNSSSSVKLRNRFTQFFLCSKDLRQGCP